MRGRKKWGPWMFGAPWMMGRCGPYVHAYWHHESSREEEIEALEEFQRDLEQAAADVAERIRELRENLASTDA